MINKNFISALIILSFCHQGYATETNGNRTNDLAQEDHVIQHNKNSKKKVVTNLFLDNNKLVLITGAVVLSMGYLFEPRIKRIIFSSDTELKQKELEIKKLTSMIDNFDVASINSELVNKNKLFDQEMWDSLIEKYNEIKSKNNLNYVDILQAPNVLEELIKRKIDMNHADKDGHSLLYDLLSKKYKTLITNRDELIKNLFQNKAIDVNYKDTKGNTVLHNLINDGDLDGIKDVLASPDIDVNIQNNDKLTPLSIAFSKAGTLGGDNSVENNTYIDIFKELMRRDDVNINLDMQSLLISAFSYNDEELLNLIFSRKDLDVNYKKDQNNGVLHAFIINGNTDALKKVLKHPNIDVNIVNDDGYTPLHMAITHDELEELKELISHKNIDLTIKDRNKMTPFDLAINSGKKDFIKVFLPHTNIEAKNAEGLTPLHRIAKDKNLINSADLIELLIAKGADINAVDNDMNTALHFASDTGNEDAVKALIKHSNINKKTKNTAGKTPLDLAKSDSIRNRLTP